MLIRVRSHVQGIFYPQRNENINLASALAAIDRQRVARIVKTAVYVFASFATATSIMLTEAAAVTWFIAIPTLTITLAAWMIFWKINRLEMRYIEGISDKMRSDLAKSELDRLLFRQSIEAYRDTNELRKAFENINTLLACEAISPVFLKGIIEIKERAPASAKTLHEVAQECCIPLSLSHSREKLEKGRFGHPSCSRMLEIKWDGKREEAIEIVLKTITK